MVASQYNCHYQTTNGGNLTVSIATLLNPTPLTRSVIGTKLNGVLPLVKFYLTKTRLDTINKLSV